MNSVETTGGNVLSTIDQAHEYVDVTRKMRLGGIGQTTICHTPT